MSSATYQTIIHGVALLAAVLGGICCYEAGMAVSTQPGWSVALLQMGVFCGLTMIAMLVMARAAERL